MPIIPSLELERRHWKQGYSRVAGVDEVGVACLGGPVLAAACVLPQRVRMIDGVRDSKTLSAVQRERLFDRIIAQAAAVGFGAASVAEIERLNILNATHLAMQRALRKVRPYDFALIDGRGIKNPDMGPHITIVDGDASCYAIACASVVAKVMRDRLMRKLATKYPGYGWERNVGYPTKEHLNAIRELGITPYHRRTFAPVRMMLGLPGLGDLPKASQVGLVAPCSEIP